MIVSKERIPKIRVSGAELPMLETNEEFSRSGFYTRVSFYMYFAVMLQFGVFFVALSAISIFFLFIYDKLRDDKRNRLGRFMFKIADFVFKSLAI